MLGILPIAEIKASTPVYPGGGREGERRAQRVASAEGERRNYSLGRVGVNVEPLYSASVTRPGDSLPPRKSRWRWWRWRGRWNEKRKRARERETRLREKGAGGQESESENGTDGRC